MIIFSKETLREALNGLRVLKLPKQVMPACQRVLIFGYESVVEFDGTDLDQYLRYEGPAASTAAIRVLVPYEVLVNAAKQADATGEIRIVPGDEPSIIYPVSGTLLTVPFPPLDVAEFPPKPVPGGDTIRLPAGVIGAMNEALGCASTDTTRYLLNSVYLDAHAVVATDGRQLYRRNSLDLSLSEGAIFPCSGVPGVLPDTEAELHIWKNEDRRFAQIAVGRWRWVTKLIDGKFPHYAQVIPKLENYGATVRLAEADVARLRSVVPKLPGFKDRNSVVVLQISPEDGVSLCTAPKLPRVRVVLDHSEVVCADPIQVGFNAKYFLGALETGLRELRVRDTVSPLLLVGESRLQMWMPYKIDDSPVRSAEPTPSAPSPSDSSAETPTPVGPSGPAAQIPAVSETDVSKNQPIHTTITMVAPSNTQPVSKTREGAGKPVTSAPCVALPETPVSAVDAVQAKLGKVRDLLRDLGNEIGGLQGLLRESTRQYKALERDHESLKKNIRALREVPV